jgi:peptidoglycan L-alanyl-D-glutamate endopeptidase CwlK
MKQAAMDLGVQIEWGGDWTSFKDGPHFQLSPQVYAA